MTALIADNTLDIRLANLTATVYPAEEGGYWAEVADLPGCITEADTLDELVINLNEAIEGWLSVQLSTTKTCGRAYNVF